MARILHIIPSLDPAHGGPPEGFSQISKAMLERGNHVEVLVLEAEGMPWHARFKLPVHAIGTLKNSYRYTPAMNDWLQKNHGRFDIFVLHTLWNYTGLGAWRVLKRNNRPYFVFVHGMLDPWFAINHPIKHIKKLVYWTLFERRVLRDAKKVLFTCEEERRLAENSFPFSRWQGFVLGYGLHGLDLDSTAVKKAFMKKFPLLADRRFLLFLSRIHPKKGCDLLIRAYAKAKREGLPHALAIAGPDKVGWKKELQRIAKQEGVADSVQWLGELSGDEKWGAFIASEFFVLTSHQENFGIAVAESLACGTPVLITRKINIWREIESQGAGLICDDNQSSVDEMIGKLAEIAPEERVSMGENAKICFDRHFKIEAAAERLTHLISESLVESQPIA